MISQTMQFICLAWLMLYIVFTDTSLKLNVSISALNWNLLFQRKSTTISPFHINLFTSPLNLWNYSKKALKIAQKNHLSSCISILEIFYIPSIKIMKQRSTMKSVSNWILIISVHSTTLLTSLFNWKTTKKQQIASKNVWIWLPIMNKLTFILPGLAFC